MSTEKLESIENKLYELIDTVDIICKRTYELNESIDNILELMDLQKLMEIYNSMISKFKDILETCDSNVRKVNQMTNELKGCVSMSRASINAAKDFASHTFTLTVERPSKKTRAKKDCQ